MIHTSILKMMNMNIFIKWYNMSMINMMHTSIFKMMLVWAYLKWYIRANIVRNHGIAYNWKRKVLKYQLQTSECEIKLNTCPLIVLWHKSPNGQLTSGIKPMPSKWLLSSGSWNVIRWEKTARYSTMDNLVISQSHDFLQNFYTP